MTETPRTAPQGDLAEAAKAEQRRAAGRRRKAAAAAATPDTAEALKQRFLETIALQSGLPVSGFWPIGSEIDPRPLLKALDAAGHPLGLPVVPGLDQPLIFRNWRPGQALGQAGFGLSEPDEAAGEMTPGLLLVPLLAFDREGFRLGYGGGFYDRTLEKLRAANPRTLAVGLAYAAQEAEAVPLEPTDQRLDWILTESEAIRIDVAAKGFTPGSSGA